MKVYDLYNKELKTLTQYEEGRELFIKADTTKNYVAHIYSNGDLVAKVVPTVKDTMIHFLIPDEVLIKPYPVVVFLFSVDGSAKVSEGRITLQVETMPRPE